MSVIHFLSESYWMQGVRTQELVEVRSEESSLITGRSKYRTMEQQAYYKNRTKNRGLQRHKAKRGES